MSEAIAPHRAGIAAIVGPPNAGKSTLLNRILGEKIAIVTAKPQTTRSKILGILTEPGFQILFLDTPGLHRSEKKLNQHLNESVDQALADCDVALLLVDRTRAWSDTHTHLLETLERSRKPIIVVGTKSDLVHEQGAWRLDEAREHGSMAVSARTGEGIDALLQRTVGHLPESAPYYGDDELTDRPMRWLAAELVREAAFEALDQELPYELAVEVVKFDESREDLISIRANLIVRRNSQKRIVVGRGGEQIKAIGIRARQAIEALVGCHVHLDLWVKIEPRWLASKKRLESLGY